MDNIWRWSHGERKCLLSSKSPGKTGQLVPQLLADEEEEEEQLHHKKHIFNTGCKGVLQDQSASTEEKEAGATARV